jgi:transcription elongation factor Elf1
MPQVFRCKKCNHYFTFVAPQKLGEHLIAVCGDCSAKNKMELLPQSTPANPVFGVVGLIQENS